MRRFDVVVLVVLCASIAGSFGAATPARAAGNPKVVDRVGKVIKTEAEWQRVLTPEQFRVLRQAGTEIAFTGKYWNQHGAGTYRCAACGLDLFSSKAKFESGTGWPSFWQPIAKTHVIERADSSLGDIRVEVLCARCGGHLGHLFPGGPPPTGLRYCMNSVAMSFVPKR